MAGYRRRMRDTDLYAKILGIERPWRVSDVRLDVAGGEVEVVIEYAAGVTLACPECGAQCPGYDSRPRRWRHLDTMQYRTILTGEIPRVECDEHGVRQVSVPWGEPGSRFTALFEALAIDWLKEASLTAVARILELTWDEAAGIQQRAVRRGLARRERRLPEHIGVDETSFQKRHEYVTVVHDQDSGDVVHIADGRKRACLEDFFAEHSEEERAAVETVAMDMWPAYIFATKAQIPDAVLKICFDRFHVAQHLSKAVDQVRRQEHRTLKEVDDDQLKGSRYLWLTSPDHMSDERWASFTEIRESALKTARAWAIKELAATLWNYRSRYWAFRAWRRWLAWAFRSRLEPIRRVARMVREHLTGIINAIVLGVTNARSEGTNAKIQWIKYTARGYRNRERFRNAIYFHLGGLDLYPASLAR